MLTSGQPLKYHNAMHVFHEIIWLEGFSALFRGVTANMLLGVAGAGVLAGYDQLCRIAYKHGHSTGPHPVLKQKGIDQSEKEKNKRSWRNFLYFEILTVSSVYNCKLTYQLENVNSGRFVG
ncbi:hypothetical protein Vadar_022809 [Vaccinium darrowii]|uniref:Uncharacterized protein n=1 Tax=Vaccinium darrowii TaxID=229202 RepID=A0ACB7Z6N0_9ERIC|nr:hypothetical protein Vadar_022809 [Vaccinium darrowii]